MKVLVIGGGGREHAIVWSLRKSPKVTEVVCAPGNAGIAQIARCVSADAGSLEAMVSVAQTERPDLTVIGPELPLSLGVVDELTRLGFRVFGPTKRAAQLETSKVFAKEFMQRHEIPSAQYAAQDHERIGEGDTGPNTGGMGAYTGDGLLSAPMQMWVLKNIAQRVVDEMAMEGTPFKGALFCGLMMVPQRDGTTLPMVLEFNTRFGDPETQAILVRLESDIVDIFNAAVDETADQLAIRMRPGASVCVIAASGGYPGKYKSGLPISGLDAMSDADTVVFHSGTAAKDGQITTAGGRVLAVTSISGESAAS